MSYAWDPENLEANLRKHGVDFADAVEVLEDPLAITIPDPDHSPEERFVTLGMDGLGRLLVVLHLASGSCPVHQRPQGDAP